MTNQNNQDTEVSISQSAPADEHALRLAAEARVKELEALLADTQSQLGKELSLQEDGHRFRHLMFWCVDWDKNGKDDDAVMLTFGPYKSHTLRASVDEAAKKVKEVVFTPVLTVSIAK